MKKHHSTAQLLLALMIGTLVSAFVSCKKSPDTIGNNLISDGDYIGVFKTDTVQIVCHSYLDSVNTTNASTALLGAIMDPVFGRTEAGFFTQFRFSVAGQSFGTNPVMDSLVLQLGISSCSGDTTTLQTVHVYELLDTLSTNATYYNHSVVATDNVDHASGFQFRPRPRTKVHVIGTDTIAQPIVRIPLSQALGQYLMTLDSTAYSRPDLFKEQFHGLYVACSPVMETGAMTYVNLTSNSYTMLQLYYHDAATPDKPMRYNYYVSSSDAYFNHFDHDYELGNNAFVSQLVEGQEDLGQEKIYLQTMGGVRAYVTFPNVEHWADSLEGCHMVINQARLILPAAEEGLDSLYSMPSSFILLGFKADSTTYLLPDYYEGTGFFDGSFNSSSKSVSFRVTEYMQRLIMKKTENHGLSLGINGASYNAQRMVINGPNAPQGEKMRLEVTYSLVND